MKITANENDINDMFHHYMSLISFSYRFSCAKVDW